MAKDISISICVPAFNEKNTLRDAVEDLIKTLSLYVQKLEIIIVDDGSIDSTPQLADQIAKEYSQIKVIHHKRNLGIGVSYRDALAVADGTYYTWFPADHENSSQEFIQCLPYLKEDTIVICHHQGQDPRSFMRRIVSGSYTRLLNRCFRLKLKYYNGLAIFPTSVLRSLHLVANGFILLAESLIKASRYGCQVVELPVALGKRNCGKSKALSLLATKQMANDILRIFLKQNNKVLKPGKS